MQGHWKRPEMPKQNNSGDPSEGSKNKWRKIHQKELRSSLQRSSSIDNLSTMASTKYLIFEPTREQRDFCINFLKEGSMANRGTFDGDYHQQLFGLMAQVIVSDFLGLARPENQGFDGGVDLEIAGKKFDVKCVIRTVDPKPHFANNLTAFQMKYDIDGYIFASYNKTTGLFTVCGWVTKKEFKEKAEYFPEGSQRYRDDGTLLTLNESANYELPNKDLRKLEHHNKMVEIFIKKSIFEVTGNKQYE